MQKNKLKIKKNQKKIWNHVSRDLFFFCSGKTSKIGKIDRKSRDCE